MIAISSVCALMILPQSVRIEGLALVARRESRHDQRLRVMRDHVRHETDVRLVRAFESGFGPRPVDRFEFGHPRGVRTNRIWTSRIWTSRIRAHCRWRSRRIGWTAAGPRAGATLRDRKQADERDANDARGVNSGVGPHASPRGYVRSGGVSGAKTAEQAY